MKFIKLGQQKGFTLIELMIVVGIIGILVAIAAPNFSRYQSKARQSEAKIALAAVYGGEKSFYSEYASYIGSMEAIGYAPEGQRRFYAIGWSGAQANTVTGFSGNSSTPSYATNNNPYTCSGTAATLGALLATDSQSFIAVGVGCVREGATNSDSWNITDTKILTNNVIAL
ncbi:MAG TPA: prepilin-type N-terminal cleavage/methylation domain-containing protein [Bdellovibrionota bacterium]|jgi:prepilin-type N-terminal cleavage/methylation domain-containing protein